MINIIHGIIADFFSDWWPVSVKYIIKLIKMYFEQMFSIFTGKVIAFTKIYYLKLLLI